jgi:undecaprenyl-diphosphatase
MIPESWIRAIVLGTLQGCTEFLPVSSSAHLLAIPWLLGWGPGGLTFDILLHGGTLLALVLYFREPLAGLIQGVVSPDSTTGEWDRLLLPLVTGTVPILVAGVTLTFLDIERLRTPELTCFNLAFFGLLLWLADSAEGKQTGLWSLSAGQGFWIGMAQALALMPGVSRSGVTMTAALLLGLGRPEAARFAFLLGIPAISMALGAKVLELSASPDLLAASLSSENLLGVLAAFLSGLFSIRFLLRFLEKHTVKPFVVYRLVLSLLLLAWLL